MPSLDHIILLVSHSTLTSLPQFLTKNFTVTPGGRHADNLTENVLICFRDGVYIELIAFIPGQEGRETHWWGNKKEGGIIDFAFTGESAEGNWEAVNGRLEGKEVGVRYEKPVKGGRIRGDGKEVRWFVTFPELKGTRYQRGVLPFFCHDDTERTLRVPSDKENVEHSCGAQGIRSLSIYVPEEMIDELRKVYSAVLGVDCDDGGGYVVNSLNGGMKTTIVLKTPAKGDAALEKEMNERGGLFIGELIFWGKGGKELKIDGDRSLRLGLGDQFF
ncbi:glyoxalase [Glarea lozoyensis ATCC 20868]|uniref:Glyoxalase n=1 Tax=Glarea lozoyensis (strain ATCC 20868 / MF5171) TaxID=1116229 RepID=S3D0Q4_GLAL2|nr:glyoxalase [Glarea lozoyensis ATCC 20868]EPE25616.1 glyoxalase [Glarea lozoyensis ATCC 20868]